MPSATESSNTPRSPARGQTRGTAADHLTCEIRAQICDVLYRYCRAADSGDAELLRSCYHAEATDDHAIFVGARDEFVDWAIQSRRRGVDERSLVTTHTVHNVLIALDGDSAAVESYFIANHVERDAEARRLTAIHGRYLDRFRYAQDGWRIAHRRMVHDWSEERRLGESRLGVAMMARQLDDVDDSAPPPIREGPA